MIESAVLYASCFGFFVEERERGRDRAVDTEGELQLLVTARSGKDEAAPLDINCCLGEADILRGQRAFLDM